MAKARKEKKKGKIRKNQLKNLKRLSSNQEVISKLMLELKKQTA